MINDFFNNDIHKLVFRENKNKTEIFIGEYQKNLKINYTKTATIYTNLANTYFSKKDLNQAFCFYEKSLNIRVKTLGENDLQTANSYHDLGYFYLFSGECTLAKDFFEKAVNIKQKLSANTLSLANSYSHLGLCCYYVFDYSNAHIYLTKAIKIKENILDTDDIGLLTLKKNLAEVKKKYFHNSST
jgi:tetratricopeptide (TPR) repeat protein